MALALVSGGLRGGDSELALFRTARGHRAVLCQRQAARLEAAGDRDGAARWTRLGAFLEPSSEFLLERLRSWGEPPPAPPSSLLTRIGPVSREVRAALSLTWLGEPRVALEGLGDRQDPVAEAVRIQILADLGDFDEVRRRLARLELREPRSRAFCLYMRSTLAQWEGDSDAETRFLDAAYTLAPQDPEVRSALVSREVATGNAEVGHAFLEWEAGLPEVSDPSRIATRASVLATLGRMPEAERELARLEREHLVSPQTLIVRAGLRLRQGRRDEAAGALETMVQMTRGSMVLVPAANLLASIGRQDLSHMAIARLEPLVARSPRVQHLLRMLSTYPAEEEFQTGESGPIRYQTGEDTPRSAIRGVLALFQRARRHVDVRLGRPGPKPVTVLLMYTLGEHPWGYYDAVNRRIVCRGDFRHAAQGRDEALEHLARHEYGHMAFDALLREPGEGVVPYPRWLMEGIADQLAGGVEYLGKFGYEVAHLSSEPLEEEALARILAAPVLGMGKIPQQDQARAYAQSHDMVGALLERIGPAKTWFRLAAFIRHLSRGKDLGDELERQFDVSVEDLLETYRSAQKARQR